jgi:ribosomal-protein-alanine N-acetyltransferase
VIELRTPRLHLIAATLELARAEVSDRSMLARLLDARLPADWPPPLNDDDSARFFLDYLTKHPSNVGWMAWYFVAVEDGERIAIGNGGFKGAPSDGAVEIGYSVVPRYQRNGFAGEAVRALIAWAFSHAGVDRIVAETLPELHASQALLRSLGFHETVPLEAGTLRFELRDRPRD